MVKLIVVLVIALVAVSAAYAQTLWTQSYPKYSCAGNPKVVTCYSKQQNPYRMVMTHKLIAIYHVGDALFYCRLAEEPDKCIKP